MAIIYILATLTILAFHFDHIIPGLGLVLHSAFTGKAATGGFAGAGFAVDAAGKASGEAVGCVGCIAGGCVTCVVCVAGGGGG